VMQAKLARWKHQGGEHVRARAQYRGLEVPPHAYTIYSKVVQAGSAAQGATLDQMPSPP
jgi:hypothetical protein